MRGSTRRARIATPMLIVWLLLALIGCTQPHEPPATAEPQAALTTPAPARPSPTAPPAATPRALDGWRVLYRRAGADAGASIDLRAVGDIMLGRLIGTIGRRNGFDYPFAQARALLAGDLALGNLESPLTDRQAPLRPGPYRLPAAPAFAAPLRAAGFAALSLANNHALDAGTLGLRDATTALSTTGILPLGAGPSADAARAPAWLTLSGMRIALFAFNDIHDPEDQGDEGQGWGRAWLDEAALQRIQQARISADLLIVMVHWGREYQQQPTPRQREWARRLVGAGADLVLGAHPHVLQGSEPLESAGHTGFVAYSLGNFIFDQADQPETSTSAVLRVLLDRQGVALVAAAPVAIVAGQARPLPIASAAGQAALARLSAAPQDSSPTTTLPPAAMQAWSWDGRAAQPVLVPAGTQLVERPARLPVDLRGNGTPLWASLDERGMVELRDGAAPDAPLVWSNEAADWRVTRIDTGDLDHDGRIELLLLLWRPDGSHPFMVGWRGGRYRVIWGGSATATPMQDLAIGDLDGDGRQELVVLEGGSAPGDMGQTVSIWSWNGWMFDRRWRSPVGSWSRLALQDLTGDGRPEVLVSGP